MQKVRQKLNNLFQRNIFWCGQAEKIFWSDILKDNLWKTSVWLRIYKKKSLIGGSLL